MRNSALLLHTLDVGSQAACVQSALLQGANAHTAVCNAAMAIFHAPYRQTYCNADVTSNVP